MALLKKSSFSSGKASTAVTLLVLGLVVGGSLFAVGSWALAGTMTGNSASTPSLSDTYGDQFLLTNSQLANQPAANQDINSDIAADSTASPLKNWSYTRTLSHVSPAH